MCGCIDGTHAVCIGRCLFAVPLLVFGLFHFMKGQEMAGMLAAWPFPLFFVYLSGAGLVLGALAIILNRYARLAAFLLAAEITLIILSMHVPGIIAGGPNMQMSLMGALKDLSLVGGALVIASCMGNRACNCSCAKK